MNKYDIINQYINDEPLLLEIWYTKTMALEMGIEEDIEFKSAFPSHDKIKEKFLDWVAKHKKKLYKLICEDFSFKEKRNEYEDVVNLVNAVSEVLDVDYSMSIEISSLLLLTVLDDFCQ